MLHEIRVPTISVIIGEGGSGGAIALASASKVIMLENAIYSVISPEGCATILWRDPKKMLDAARAMKLSATDLLELKVIDEVISEPIGGAHRDRDTTLEKVKSSIIKNLEDFSEMSRDEIINFRKNKFLKIGRNKGFISNPENLSSLKSSESAIQDFIRTKKTNLNWWFNINFNGFFVNIFIKNHNSVYIFFQTHRNMVRFSSFFFLCILGLSFAILFPLFFD